VIVQGAVSPDHVHMLVSVPPQLAPAKLVQYMKGRPSRLLQDEFPQLKKRYWGQHLWARGYFCASVGAMDEETIRKYIESQQWEDSGENFKSPRPASLRRLSAVSLPGGFSRKQATFSRNQTHRLSAGGRLDETNWNERSWLWDEARSIRRSRS
jgi:hypothetical protein